VPAGQWNAVYGDKTSKSGKSSGLYDKDGSIYQDKLLSNDPKAVEELVDAAATWYKPGSFDRENAGELIDQLERIQLLTGKSSKGVMSDFKILTDKGNFFIGGTEEIDSDAIDSYYKGKEILLKTPEGKTDYIPMGTAIKNLSSKDKDGDPYYLLTNVNGKVQLSYNPDYTESAFEKMTRKKRDRQLGIESK
jgi:hypothetical protein